MRYLLLITLIIFGNNLMAEKVTTPTGLIYECKKEGTETEAKAGDTVEVHYTGWLNDNGTKGTKFDSSVDRDATFKFVLGANTVISGWEEGVLGMKKGEKRELMIPSHLGYGAAGAGGVIPANADLIFDVELVDIK